MWHGTETLIDLILGDHEINVVADAWYRGRSTVADLPVVSASFTETYEASSATVRSSMQLELMDEDGTLTPSDPTDPLAPYGQSLVVALELSAGQAVERVPLGQFRVEPVSSDSGWRDVTKRGRTRWVSTGGKITVPLVDNLARVIDAELWGFVAPRGPTVLAELDRLLRGAVGITTDWTGVTNQSLSAGGNAYGESRIQACAEYARRLGRVLACTRDGAITLLSPNMKSTPDLSIIADDPADARWVDSQYALDRDGIYNLVEVTGQAPSGSEAPPPTGISSIPDGPFGTDVMGPRVLRQHSEFVHNRNQATNAARARQLTSVRGRTQRFQVTSVQDPRVQVLDTHVVTAQPGVRRLREVKALVVGVEMAFPSKQMVTTYEVPLEDVIA